MTNFILKWHIYQIQIRSLHCLVCLSVPNLTDVTLVCKHCQRHNGPEGWVHLAKVILQVQTQILIEYHLQNFDSASTRNLNQTSASPLNLKFKMLTQPSFRISTKIRLHNLYKTSAAKCWTSSSFKILLNFNFKILTNPCAQSLKKSLVLGPNVSSQICNKLLPTWSSLSTSATVTTSTSFELASSHARVTSIKFTKRQWVSELGS